MSTPKDVKEDNIFLKKLVSYHEATIAQQQETIHRMQVQSEQMQQMLKVCQEKLVMLEAEKTQSSGSPLRDILSSIGPRRG